MATPLAAHGSGARAWWFVAVLCAAAILSIIDRTILSLVVDPVRADLGLTDVEISLLQGLAFGAFYATAGLALGVVVDRHSRRALIIAGLAIWSLATVAAGFARNFEEFFITRVLVGFGEAALAPAAISIIADLFPTERRGRPMGFYMAGQAIANGLAIFLTGKVLAAAADQRLAWLGLPEVFAPWRAVFVVFGASGLVFVLLLLTCREPARQGPPAEHNLGAQLRDVFAFLRARRQVFVPLYLGFAVAFAAAYGAAAWTPSLLMRVYEVAPNQLAATLGPWTMAFAAIGPLLGGWLVDRAVKRQGASGTLRLLVGVPLLAIPAALAVFAPTASLATILIASSSAVFAVIGLCVLTTLQSQLPARMRGTGVAVTGLLNTLIGAVCGPFLVALVTDHVYQEPLRVGHSIAIVIVPILILAAVLFLLAAMGLNRESLARESGADPR
jgi:MFS family permease